MPGRGNLQKRGVRLPLGQDSMRIRMLLSGKPAARAEPVSIRQPSQQRLLCGLDGISSLTGMELADEAYLIVKPAKIGIFPSV